ncbi:hypothetical protein [Pontibacter qinzhouensis]|uniref:hypothetical protein n=1 Tax=Pontibacter qinzhouensis TaxID=2603253 RepID=UPI001C9BCF49|nr:hypothetical protein [Pontibacter qinzhouensis]
MRSSHSHFLKRIGLRWVSLMLLMPMNWAGRVWALPFLTLLALSKRYAQEAGKRYKKITDWARQMLLQLKRWLPNRQVIAVGDSSYTVLDWMQHFMSLLRPECRANRGAIEKREKGSPPCSRC